MFSPAMDIYNTIEPNRVLSPNIDDDVAQKYNSLVYMAMSVISREISLE